jgi:hypothetical protein
LRETFFFRKRKRSLALFQKETGKEERQISYRLLFALRKPPKRASGGLLLSKGALSFTLTDFFSEGVRGNPFLLPKKRVPPKNSVVLPLVTR